MFSVLRRKPSTDVLLLDIKMPGFKVYEAVAQLRAQHPHLKILIVTVPGGFGAGLAHHQF
jgi:DNA-binding NarL/FixJ family response regulator